VKTLCGACAQLYTTSLPAHPCPLVLPIICTNGPALLPLPVDGRYFKGAACSSGQRTTVLRALYPVVNFNNCTENWSDGSESLEEFEARIDGIKR
jgi:hypothetical protein